MPRGGGRSYLAGQGLISDWPMWEGNGGSTSFVRSGEIAIPIANAVWGRGRVGLGMQGTGTDTDYFRIPDSEVSVGLRQQLPLSVEVVFEQLSAPTTGQGSAIWQNHSRTVAYAGMKIGVFPGTLIPHLLLGDNSGASAADRKSWFGSTAIQDNVIYHAIFSVGGFGAGDAEIFINGLVESMTDSGTGSSLGYSSAGNGVTFCGGDAPNYEGFDGRVYSLKYFNRRIFATEAKMRANRLYSDIFSIPYPVETPPVVPTPDRLFSRLRRTA